MPKFIRKVRHWWRSSVTGKFVSKLFAEAHPNTTEEQSMRDEGNSL